MALSSTGIREHSVYYPHYFSIAKQRVVLCPRDKPILQAANLDWAETEKRCVLHCARRPQSSTSAGITFVYKLRFESAASFSLDWIYFYLECWASIAGQRMLENDPLKMNRLNDSLDGIGFLTDLPQ